VREEYKKKTGIAIDELGESIIKEKNVVKFSVGDTKKDTKHITDFKPSGKFVYDDILLESIKNKL
jgi:hypothetical protein